MAPGILTYALPEPLREAHAADLAIDTTERVAGRRIFQHATSYQRNPRNQPTQPPSRTVRSS